MVASSTSATRNAKGPYRTEPLHRDPSRGEALRLRLDTNYRPGRQPVDFH